MRHSHRAWFFPRALVPVLFFGVTLGCGAGDSANPGAGSGSGAASSTGSSAQGTGGAGTTAGTAGSAVQGTGAAGAGAGTSGSTTQAQGDASMPDASSPQDGGPDAAADGSDSNDGASDAVSVGDVVTATPDGGAYSRTGWTATSMPPFPTGRKAQNQDLKYSNAFDGNYNTRWSIGDTNSPAQTIGDQFTFDMLAPHAFRKILFWAGGLNGANGPDPRDYPGALDLSISNDGINFGPAVGSGTEPQPGCGNCTMPFTITLAQPAVARYVRLTLTKRLQLGGGIWWAISELYVYP
ncbi:MAG TPA: discoidin domain-containing protein [Polyangiaceae bacterium]|nr:discoidin domain-containing protein [Polyangiaceae bacterium]